MIEELFFIDIDKEQIPYIFDIELGEDIYQMNLQYNETFDFFTIDLIKDNKILIEGEKLVYRKPLFTSIMYKEIPEVVIIPFDTTLKSKKITYDNFYKDIFLYIIDGVE